MRAEDALALAKIYVKKTLSDAGALKGEKGDPGKSAYEYAKDGGYTGTEIEFANNIARLAELTDGNEVAY